jgi:hypothetical protein
MRPLQLLFETQEAAREVALMLRYEYDGCTMITLPAMHDTLALRTAIDLVGTDFCFSGDHCLLVLPPSEGDVIRLSHKQHTNRISHKAELWCDEVPF